MKSGKLYGVGMGPGDPDLLTLRARKILETVEVVAAPKSYPDRPSLALGVAKKLAGRDFPAVLELLFPMTRDPAERDGHRTRAADAIAAELRQGRDVAFLTLGDPMLYSTWNYVARKMAERHPDIEVETVPGVSAVSWTAALTNLPLAEGDESLLMIPAWAPNLEESIASYENVVIMKIPRNPDLVSRIVEVLGRFPDRRLFVAADGKAWECPRGELDSVKKLEYMSVIFVKKDGGGRPPQAEVPAPRRAAT
ncbi:MAG: precorrin-2 C(20)-methyltransferase [Halobacteria archaeon]